MLNIYNNLNEEHASNTTTKVKYLKQFDWRTRFKYISKSKIVQMIRLKNMLQIHQPKLNI